MFHNPAGFVQGPFVCYDPSDTAFPNEVTCSFWDTHFHARRSPIMNIVLPEKARRVCGGVGEPNTFPELLIDYDTVMRYLDSMHKVAPDVPWVASVYITQEPNITDIIRLWKQGCIAHLKDYPPGGSTHTDHSASFEQLMDEKTKPGRLMRTAEDHEIPVKRHPEIVVHKNKIVDQQLREPIYLTEYETRFMDKFTRLRRILAHITSTQAVEHMRQYGDPKKYVAELPPVHGCYDRRILADGGAIIADHHCLPPVKDYPNLLSLQSMVRQKPSWLMAGSDAAGHGASSKYRFQGAGGLNVYHCDLELYIELLAGLGVIDYADAFLYRNAKQFFGDLVPDNPKQVNLKLQTWQVNATVPIPGENDFMTPFGYHPEEPKRRRFMYQLID